MANKNNMIRNKPGGGAIQRNSMPLIGRPDIIIYYGYR